MYHRCHIWITCGMRGGRGGRSLLNILGRWGSVNNVLGLSDNSVFRCHYCY